MNQTKLWIFLVFLLVLPSVTWFTQQEYDVYSLQGPCKIIDERCTCYGYLTNNSAEPPSFSCVGAWNSCEPVNERICP